MKKKGIKRSIVGLAVLISLSVASVASVSAEDLLFEDVTSGGCIKAGVASLFADADLLLVDSDSELTEIGECTIEDSLISYSDDILSYEDSTANEIVEKDLVIDNNSSDNAQKESDDNASEPQRGNIGMDDVVKASRAVEGSITLTDDEKKALDINKNGEIDMSDVLKLARFVSGSISEL